MRDPNRIDPLLRALADVWRAHPDLRLGQIVADTFCQSDRPPHPAVARLYTVEDDRLIEAVRRHLDRRPSVWRDAPGP